jgi:CPA2 family monovalent cation:H+ antiporter-2
VNPKIEIVARAHSDAEVEYLQRCGADLIIMGENEIARRMAERALGLRPSSPRANGEPVSE